MDNALILIVEDEPQIADILAAYFAREGYRTVTAGDGDLALQHHQMLSPDLVVLDVKLPRRDGFDVLAALRARGSTPVIMASAMGEDLDKLSALRIGADDYVVKPFNPVEVVARAKAVLRRTQGGGTAAALLRVAGLTVDMSAHSASLQAGDGPAQALNLTLTEFRMLSFMARSPNKAYSAASIRERIYCDADGSGMPMAGLLLYTAAPDSEGTLGGLVSQGEPERLGRLVRQALEAMQLCTSDPLCAEHHPGGDGTASLHGAACHACQFAPETSCERGNKYLDRSLLVPTLGSAVVPLFA